MSVTAFNPVCLFAETAPLTLAINMEQARQKLQSLLLKEDQATTLLLRHCLYQLDNGIDSYEVVSEKTTHESIVQGATFVQPDLRQACALLLNNALDKSSLYNLHFLSNFLIEASYIRLTMLDPGLACYAYRQELHQANKTLQQIRQIMIASNIGLATFVANKHKTTVLSVDDLIQEGLIGLIKAVDRFDPYRGFQFSTYAIPRIKQAISRLIVKQEKIVPLPVALAEKSCKVFEAMRNAYLQTESCPSVEQLKMLCDLSEDEIKTIRNYYQSTHSLDEIRETKEDDGQSLMTRMKQQQFTLPMNEIIERDFNQYLEHVVSTLPEKEAAVLNMSFGLKNHTETTLQVIADQLQVSRERVRQIQNVALTKVWLRLGGVP